MSKSIEPIRADEAYTKHMLIERLGIGQPTWDKLLDNGLPFANIGTKRWVLGADLLRYIKDNQQTKKSASDSSAK